MRFLTLLTALFFIVSCGESGGDENLTPVDTSGYEKTSSGLQYKIIKEGDGKAPTLNNEVEIHYEGKLLNGKVFDSSFKRGTTASFPLNKLVKGWQEGLPLIKEGGEILLLVPPQLGYGDQQAGIIPPNSTLYFRIKLFKVK